MQSAGFLCIPREEFISFLWKEKRKFSRAEAWFDLLSQARYSPDSEEVLTNGVLLICNQGECLRSIETWAHRWGWSKSGTARYLKLLEKRYMIRLKSETITTRITICDYEKFKPSWYASRDADGTAMARARYARGTPAVPEEVSSKKVEESNANCPGGQFVAPSSGNGASAPTQPAPLFTIPLLGKFQEYPIYQTDVDGWQETFPAVDVAACLRLVRQWNIDNSANRKTAKGIRRHITTWLTKEQNKGGGTFKRTSAGNGNGLFRRDPGREGFNALPEESQQRYLQDALKNNPALEGTPALQTAAVMLYAKEMANAR